jgi:2-polyprenyl-6-methoxyphenol hydroxylase-like FAD-dependent oxidoreductase
MQELHPAFAELIQATSEPFIQAITDVSVSRIVFGRVCLLGDAAFVVRPHTAAATAKAAADASALADAVSASPASLENALQVWEQRRLQAGHQLLQYGLSLGSRVATAR